MRNIRLRIFCASADGHQKTSSGTSVVVELNQRIKEGPLLQLVSEQKAQLHSEALAKNKGEKYNSCLGWEGKKMKLLIAINLRH